MPGVVVVPMVEARAGMERVRTSSGYAFVRLVGSVFSNHSSPGNLSKGKKHPGNVCNAHRWRRTVANTSAHYSLRWHFYSLWLHLSRTQTVPEAQERVHLHTFTLSLPEQSVDTGKV